jgi:hypothetical protein
MTTYSKRILFVFAVFFMFWFGLGLFLGIVEDQWGCLIANCILVGLCGVMLITYWLSGKLFK